MSDLLDQVQELARGLFAEAHGWGGGVGRGSTAGGTSNAERRTPNAEVQTSNGGLRQQDGRRSVGIPTRGGYRWGDRREKITFVPPRPRKGEVRMTEFRRPEATRCGVSSAVIYERLMAGKYPGIKIRKPHSRFVFVKPPPVLPGALNVPEESELPLKVYVAMEAARLRMSERAVYVRIYRGKYPGLEFRRVNGRVVFVKTKLVVGMNAEAQGARSLSAEGAG